MTGPQERREKEQATAPTAMRRFGDDAAGSLETRRALIRRLEDPAAPVRTTAAEALSEAAAEPETHDALLQTLTDPDPPTQNALSAKCDDGDALVRAAACRALTGQRTKPKVRARLLKALEDPYHCVQKAAITALAPGLPADIVDALTSDAWRSVRPPRRYELFRCLQALSKEHPARNAAAALSLVADQRTTPFKKDENNKRRLAEVVARHLAHHLGGAFGPRVFGEPQSEAIAGKTRRFTATPPNQTRHKPSPPHRLSAAPI